ncbi:unnamed protein product [Mesocestoides corti]|uniref:Uncharacterized protein n=2 Tax=Mesocestoides corti TaxID=53468 RepID=A0A0R3UH93_MESCO|nr:unnamed protein product [Mesocestoides corti]
MLVTVVMISNADGLASLQIKLFGYFGRTCRAPTCGGVRAKTRRAPLALTTSGPHAVVSAAKSTEHSSGDGCPLIRTPLTTTTTKPPMHGCIRAEVVTPTHGVGDSPKVHPRCLALVSLN